MPAFLVVDDNVPLRNIILRVIRKLSPDAAVIEVDRVEDALSALQARPFTAMIIDYRLPDGDGVEVIRWARSHEMALPIIAISGLNVEREVQAVGANYTLSKPFHIDRLTQMLRAIVEQSSHPDVASNH
jgi:DNA-binding response OmpR family regulator